MTPLHREMKTSHFTSKAKRPIQMCHDGLDTIISLNLKAQEVAEFREDPNDVKLARQALLDQVEDARAGLSTTLDEGDVDLDELLDEDGNGVDIVFANTTTDGHNDLDNDFNTSLDGDGHNAAGNLDLLNESDGGLEFLDEPLNDWAAGPVAIQLVEINFDAFMEADDNVMEVLVAMARSMRPAATTLQVLSQFGGNTIQQRTNGEIIVADGVGKSEDAKRGEEKEKSEDLGEHCGVVGERGEGKK